MNIFLCWSGPTSLKLAKALHDWLGDSIQELKPFMSSEDIRKGDRWRNEIGKRLADTNFGILCLSKYNLNSRWILFEAGAISKQLDLGRVTAVLLGVQSSEVTEPLSQFQNTTLDKEDMKRLLSDLNALLPDGKQLDPGRLTRVFEKSWPELDVTIKNLLQEKEGASIPKTRPTEEKIEEVLDLVRGISQQVQQFSRATREAAVSDLLSGRRLGDGSVGGGGLLSSISDMLYLGDSKPSLLLGRPSAPQISASVETTPHSAKSLHDAKKKET